MGDRANICLRYDNGADIYLYTHWDGYRLAGILQAALRRKQRWSDDAYLARIIATELFAQAIGEETGYGLAPFQCDNERPILYVTLDRQTVSVTPPDSEEPVTFTFQQFCDLEKPNKLLTGLDED